MEHDSNDFCKVQCESFENSRKSSIMGILHEDSVFRICMERRWANLRNEPEGWVSRICPPEFHTNPKYWIWMLYFLYFMVFFSLFCNFLGTICRHFIHSFALFGFCHFLAKVKKRLLWSFFFQDDHDLEASLKI